MPVVTHEQQSLVDWLEFMRNGAVVIDIFQRPRHPWDPDRREMLIGSILRGYPIGPIYAVTTFNTHQRISRVVMDGRERLEAIMDFSNGKIQVAGGTPGNRLAYSSLAPEYRQSFLSYPLTISRLDGFTDREIGEILHLVNPQQAASP